MTLNLVRRQTKGQPLTAQDHDSNLDKLETAIDGIQLTPGPQGPAGAAGDDGREIELQTSATHVQWRYVGGTTWTNLVALSTITGPQGSAGATGAQGPAGATGATGPAGANGQNIELQVSATHVQWRVVGGTTWANLVALSAITGPQGPAGATGPAGPTGASGGSTNWRGTWDSATAYSAATFDAVTFNGSSYVAIANSTNQAPPNATFWQLLAAKGDTGATGPAGATGAQGPQGPQGSTGATGATGSAGPQGPAGPTGPQGPQGPAGSDATATPLSNATPQALGTAAAGTATSAARGDHVHPLPSVVTASAAGLQPATSYASVTYGATVALDMAALDGQYRTISLTGNLELTSSNRATGRTVVLRLVADATQRTLTFPAGWVFLGAKPANIAASKSGVLSLTFFGSADTDCIAAWGVQS